MTTVARPPASTPYTSPVIDCEPPPGPLSTTPPHPGAAYRASHRRRRPSPPRPEPAPDLPPSRGAIMFAEASLRRVLEVVDRRRPLPGLRAVAEPPVIAAVAALLDHRWPGTSAAVLRRVRLRTVTGRDGDAAEVFATYRRGQRVRAIAGRIERVDDAADRWRLVALQLG